MRWKIIIVNSAILVIVGLLSFVLLEFSLDDVLANRSQRQTDAERALRSANVQLELDGLRLERWLAARAVEESTTEVYAGGTSQARSENASVQAKRLCDAAAQSPALAALSIPIMLFIDARGVVIGRNDSSQMRGEDLSRQYPSVAQALSTGQTSSQVWFSRERSEQLLVSYAPVRGDAGAVVGVVVAGTPLSDERLSHISETTSGRALAVGVVTAEGGVELIAEGPVAGQRTIVEAVRDRATAARVVGALQSGRSIFEQGEALYAVEPLHGYGADRVVLIAALAQSLVPSVVGLLWPLFAVTALGLLLVFAGGMFLGNYLSEPIA
jgi:hypothetical protein